MILLAVSAVLLIPLVSDKTVDAAITFNGAKCGTKTCNVDQFCSKYSSQCDDCATICTEGDHNFDNILCTRECQDYLHDLRYARSRSSEGEMRKRE